MGFKLHRSCPPGPCLPLLPSDAGCLINPRGMRHELRWTIAGPRGKAVQGSEHAPGALLEPVVIREHWRVCEGSVRGWTGGGDA